MFSKILTGLSALTLISLSAYANVNEETQTASTRLGASMVSQVDFEKGRATLKEDEMKEVATLIDDAKKKGEIDEVKVISWADREYPAEGEKASKASVRLADDRADKIKRYISKSLNVSSVKTYNMAKRPNTFQELLKTSDSKVKTTLENSGSAPTNKEDTAGLFNMTGKTSSALILVYMKH